jgi:GNAT superfamily N-acetyltransferase
MDNWLKKHALANQELGSSRTFVTCPDDDPSRVVSYYSLTFASVQHEDTPPGVRVGMPKYPIPVMLLARLAVDTDFRSPRRRTHLGSALLRDALLRTARAAEEGGLRAMMVDALHDEARRFYQRFGFEQSPTHELQLFLPMSRIRASLLAADNPAT